MKKRTLGLCAGFGVVLLVAGIVYSVLCNESRLVVPMEWGSYAFRFADLAMIVPMVWLMVTALAALVFVKDAKENAAKAKQQYTRSISPKWGLFGFLGLLGFVGFVPQNIGGQAAAPFPCLFFCFFGFFGLYYEGKMSHTLMDERYKMNALRAQAAAYRTALTLIILGTILGVSVMRIQTAGPMMQLLFSLIGIAFGLCLFLSNYLTYHYDCEDA